MIFRYLLTLAIAALLGGTLAIPTISTMGSKFFDSDGNQFFVKGVAYQLTENDPLLDVTQCQQDASLMQTLGVNSIRVYHVDPTQDHSACMSIFETAGIYLWLDLDTFYTAILQTSPQWNTTTFAAFSAVMDSFQGFDNLAGFWVGNEVISDASGSGAAIYIKAAAHDMKAHRTSKGYRNFPIGYSAADIAELRPMLQNYLACGDEASTIDFFGLNSYEWCGDSTYETSGYANLQAISSTYPIPIFFSETGCNVLQPRTFADQAAIFGSNMIDTWSGSIIYEWIEEDNNYGLVSYGGGAADSEAKSGIPSPIEPDFGNLKAQWGSCNPVGVVREVYRPSLGRVACPASTEGGWLIDGDPPIPTVFDAGTQADSGTSLLTRTSIIVPPITTKSSASSASSFTSVGVTGSPPIPSSSTGGISTSVSSSASFSQSNPVRSSDSLFTPIFPSSTGMSSSVTSVSSLSSIISTPGSSTSKGNVTTTPISVASTSSSQTSASGTLPPITANPAPLSSASTTETTSTTSSKSSGSRVGLNVFFLVCMVLSALP